MQFVISVLNVAFLLKFAIILEQQIGLLHKRLQMFIFILYFWLRCVFNVVLSGEFGFKVLNTTLFFHFSVNHIWCFFLSQSRWNIFVTYKPPLHPNHTLPLLSGYIKPRVRLYQHCSNTLYISNLHHLPHHHHQQPCSLVLFW